MPRIAAALAVVITVAICIGFNTVRYPVVLEMVAAAHQLPQSDKADQSAPTRQRIGAELSGARFHRAGHVGNVPHGQNGPIPFDSVPDPHRGNFSEATGPITVDTAPAPGDPIHPLAAPPRETVAWNPLANRADSPMPSKPNRAVESPTAEYVRNGPVEAAPSSKYGFGPVAARPRESIEPESDRSAALIGRRPLVPVDTASQAGRARKKKRATPGPSVGFRWGGNESDHRGTKVERLPAIDTPSEIPQRLIGPTTPGNRIPIYPSTGP